MTAPAVSISKAFKNIITLLITDQYLMIINDRDLLAFSC